MIIEISKEGLETKTYHSDLPYSIKSAIFVLRTSLIKYLADEYSFDSSLETITDFLWDYTGDPNISDNSINKILKTCNESFDMYIKIIE